MGLRLVLDAAERVTALLLAPLTRFRPRPTGGELAGGLLLGGMVAVGFLTQTVGLVITTPSRSAFIVAVSSVLAPPLALLFLSQRSSWLTAAALALATTGIFLLTDPDAGGLNRGDLWTFVTAVCFGGQMVAVRELAIRYDARRMVWFEIASTALLAAVALSFFEHPRVAWTPGLAAALAYVVVGASTTAFILQMYAQRHMSAARAALIFCFEPVFAAVTSWLVLGERLSVLQWLGGALIVVGMVAADLPLSRQPSVGTFS